MATAKKVASKKATASKTAAVKKTPVRRNTRKSALPENIPAAADLDLGATNPAAEQAPVSNETQASEGISLEDQLAEIEVIDMRDMPPVARVALFQTLDGLGYLERSSLQPVMASQANTAIGLFGAEAISFNHTNKLLVLSYWNDVKDSYAISRVNIEVATAIEFSTPGPVDPDYMTFGDSHYVRVPKKIRDAAISALDIIRKDI